MKLLILACIVYSVYAAGDLTDEQKIKLKTLKEACIQEASVDPAVIEHFASESQVLPENDEKFGCFSSCLLQKTGILTDDGKIRDDVFRSKIPADLPNEKVEQIVSHCGQLRGENLCELGGKLVKCFTEEKAFTIIY